MIYFDVIKGVEMVFNDCIIFDKFSCNCSIFIVYCEIVFNW